jgi:hypothetical protein
MITTTTQNTMNNTVKFDTLKIVAKLDVPAGKRLCRIIHKAASGKESVGALVPQLVQDDILSYVTSNSKIAQFVMDAFYDMQDKLVRATMRDDNTLGIEQFALLPLVAYIESTQESKGRISKESIETWFTADMLPLLVSALKAKGLTIQKQIDDTCNAFKNSFSSLAGRNVSMEEKIKLQLTKALALLPEGYPDNSVVEYVSGKLLEVQEATAVIDAL